MRKIERKNGEQADLDLILSTRLCSGHWMMSSPSFPHVIFSSMLFVADGHGQVAPMFLEARQSLSIPMSVAHFGNRRSYLISSVVLEEEIQEFGMGEGNRGKTGEVDLRSRLGHIPSRNILQKLRCRES